MAEFKCMECGYEFDVPADDDNKWACPRCKDGQIARHQGDCAVCGKPIYNGDTHYYCWKTSQLFCGSCVTERM
ncbi:MAG: hypothetical protein ACI4KR_04585 [Ruminiclostridium sp.]